MIRNLDGFLLNRRSLGAATVLLLFAILVACLWPFRASRNTVSWVKGEHGIAFGSRGVVLGADLLSARDHQRDTAFTFELWLQADSAAGTGSILSVYSAGNPRQFAIEQWHNDLALRGTRAGDSFRTGGASSYSHAIFAPGKTVFVTVASDESGTKVYKDGNLVQITRQLQITNRMLSGRLVIGTAAAADRSWHGQLKGLAIYTRAFGPEEILHHYRTWRANGRPEIGDSSTLLALWLFEEGMGRRIRSQPPRSMDLYVPEYYIIPAKPFLAPISFNNPTDIIANIVGFMPFGFTLCGYLICSGRTRLAVLESTLASGIIAMLVESLQGFLPTRDSSVTDVITNVLGGALGAFLYVWATRRKNTSQSAEVVGGAGSRKAGAV